jgi:hypothetical protein
MDGVSRIVDAYLAHHFAFRPVDATFMGVAGHDHRLPDSTADAPAQERAGLEALTRMLDAEPLASDLGSRLDRRLVASQIAVARAALEATPRFANPAWWTGEAAFSIIGLLLPQSSPTKRDAVLSRLTALPDFLADGVARLDRAPTPSAWAARATREATAMAAFLREDVALHADWDEGLRAPATRAALAFESFAEAISDLPDRSAACGADHVALLMREAHGLTISPAEAIRRAEAGFSRMTAELKELAARIDPERTWSEQIADLSRFGATSAEAVADRYRTWDALALRDGAGLVTPASDYDLEYRWLDPCFRRVARDLYFLSYRSPPAGAPGAGSVYWVQPPAGEPAAYLAANADAPVKIVHAVHHGSVGHHTQNARAREAASVLARLGGTDCALGIAFLSSGSMVEGWACYVQDLMKEADGFYTPAETLLLKQMERRNAASVMVDIRLGTGEWSPAQAAAFYRGEAGFAAARVDGEVTRNSMLPATRLMYWLGIEAIRDARSRWSGTTRDFHDTLLSYGHVPVAWAAEEMDQAGRAR